MDQILLIKRVKKYIVFLKTKKIDLTRSAFVHLISWAKSPGYAKLKILHNDKIDLRSFLLLTKFLISSIFFTKKISIFPNKKVLNNKIIISWCVQKDFSYKGKFQDRYFGITNRESGDFFWILISMDGYIPEKIPKNILIIDQKNTIKNFFTYFKNFTRLILTYNFSVFKVSHYIFPTTEIGEQLSKKISEVIKIEKLKVILLPYEGQTFQKIIINKIRKVNKKAKIVGYLHSSLPPLPAEFFYNKLYAPDLLFCHGVSYKKILNRFLDWPKDRIKIIKSLKYHLHESKKFKADIYLPYEINNKELLIKEFEDFIKSNSEYNFSNHNILIHPVKKNFLQHIKFMNKIKSINKNYKKNKKIMNKKIPIFFGNTTLFEGLEIYSEVIHISSDPVFEGLDNNFWPYISVKKFSDYVYKYKLLKQGAYIIFGNKSNNKRFINQV